MFTPKGRSATATVAVAASLMTVFAPPAGAAVGSMTARLSIARLPGTARVCDVRVSGVVSMTQAEAQDRINRGYRVIFRGWGDDPVSDDFIFGPDPASTTATSTGLSFSGSRGLPCSSLSEDVSTFDNRDEIYAGVRLVTGYLSGTYGPTVRSAETNRIIGYF